MKLANTSFIQTSSNHRIVTRSPNHMCDGLVRDDAGAVEQLVLRGRLVEQQRGRVVEDRAGVLHAAELERRDQHEIELAERVRDAGVVLEPGERRRMQVEDRVAVARDLGGVGLAMEHPERAAVALAGLDREPARRRRRRDRWAAAASRRSVTCGRPSRVVTAARRRWPRACPARRDVERERAARLEVGLVEAGKRQVGARRHEQRVEEVVVAVERLVAGGELDRRRRSHPARVAAAGIVRWSSVKIAAVTGTVPPAPHRMRWRAPGEIDDDPSCPGQREPQDDRPRRAAAGRPGSETTGSYRTSENAARVRGPALGHAAVGGVRRAEPASNVIRSRLTIGARYQNKNTNASA